MSTAVWTSNAFTVEGSGSPPMLARNCSMISPLMPETAGAAIDVPHMSPYVLLGKVDRIAAPFSHPGATISGFRRPSSSGPQLLKVVIESSSELVAPTARIFLAVGGGGMLA